jgi:hypothetical protein
MGGRNAHEIAVLEEGMEFQPISLKAEDVQFLEARNFQVFGDDLGCNPRHHSDDNLQSKGERLIHV